MEIPTCPHCEALLIVTDNQTCHQSVSVGAVDYQDPEIEKNNPPDLSGMTAQDLFPQQKKLAPVHPLEVTQQIELRKLLEARVHPDKIYEYLNDIGYDENQIESLFDELNLRRSHLLSLYRVKITMKWVGALLVIGGIFASMGNVFFVGLIGFGIYLMFFA